MIDFPKPVIDRFTILHNRSTHEVDIPYLPSEHDGTMSVLVVFIYSLAENGILGPDEVVQIAEQAAGLL
jgi:hypothetical protein